jgi:hypothetical protein
MKKENRVAEALKRLKVKPEKVAEAPQITPLFKNAEGGLKGVLNAMRFSAQDEVIATFLKKYDSIPEGDRQRVPWEAVAIAARLDIRQLTGSILFAMQAASASMVKVIALSSHPLITKARITYGQLPGGDKDRNAIDTALGFLPSPKGPTFIGKAVFGSTGTKEKEESEPNAVFGEDDDLDDLFPMASSMQEKLVPIRQRLLEG